MIDGDALPTLRAERVRLRAIDRDDVDALFEIFSDPDVMRYWSSPPMVHRSEAAHLLSRIEEHFRKRDLFQWGIVRTDDDRVIGTCTLAHLNVSNRRAELGFALARPHWRKGLMREALGALLDFGFGELNLHRLEADVDPRNEASIRILERVGFRREGFLRERWLTNGETQDTVLLGLLQKEWRPR
jgi:RimJ/RimL family protein N-acetyltransferase